ncbi:MAG: hypothetical protein KatS3mg031_0591 [Chitinophagales bacterium]|nr:MAG: hypothetical protein KatS3mg031_0591 [Chitinophagales bacterium]
MQTTFTVSLEDFKKMITQANRIIKKIDDTITKISVQPESIEFEFVGIQRTLPAMTETYCDVLVPFKVLLGIAKTATTPRLTLTFKDGQMNTDKINVSHKAIKVQSLFSNKEIPLPVNPSLADILKLRKLYDKEKLIELNLMPRIESAEQELKDRLNKAAALLKDFGVKFSDLESLVNSKIN